MKPSESPSQAAMNSILNHPMRPNQAGLWYLGQAGYVFRGCGHTAAIDPYLTDSVTKVAPELARLLPVPIEPEDLRVDVFIVTHDHLDHLDPETIERYPGKDRTTFVAPHLACAKLRKLGVPEGRIVCVDWGGRAKLGGLTVEGVYALGTEEAVLDTTGYVLRFDNGRSAYHSSDTGPCPRVLAEAPRAEVLLACINGKWGNLNPEQAAELATKVKPRYAIPNHYDMMRPNLEDPANFERILKQIDPAIAVRILRVMEPFVW
jgi:L-ascorbate 6-phosphate lactonase